MKKLLLLSTLLLSTGAWAECSTQANILAVQKCLNNEVKTLKLKLDNTLKNASNQTEAKVELNKSQQLWLKYKEVQCGDFTLADAGASPGQISYDLACQATLYKQRIEFLDTIFR